VDALAVCEHRPAVLGPVIGVAVSFCRLSEEKDLIQMVVAACRTDEPATDVWFRL